MSQQDDLGDQARDHLRDPVEGEPPSRADGPEPAYDSEPVSDRGADGGTDAFDPESGSTKDMDIETQESDG